MELIYGHHGGIPILATFRQQKLNIPKYQQLYKTFIQVAEEDLRDWLESDRNTNKSA